MEKGGGRCNCAGRGAVVGGGWDPELRAQKSIDSVNFNFSHSERCDEGGGGGRGSRGVGGSDNTHTKTVFMRGGVCRLVAGGWYGHWNNRTSYTLMATIKRQLPAVERQPPSLKRKVPANRGR